MKNLFVVLLVLLFPLAQAQKFPGSPGQDLFDQAAFFLETQYFGPSTVSIASLVAKYQLEVDKVCAPAAQKCSYETVEPLIADMLDEMGDGHAYYIPPADYAVEQQQSTGTDTSKTPRLGFAHAMFIEYQKQTYPQSGFPQQLLDLVQKGDVKVLNFDRTVLQVISGGPADKAGVRPGDRLVGYNGTRFSSFTNFAEYATFMMALNPKIQAGEKVSLQIVRGANKTPISLEMTGEIINSVPFPTMYIDENNVAIIRIYHFLIDGMGQHFHNLMRTAIEKNVKAVIVDLRGAAGGYGSESMISLVSFLENPDALRYVPRYNADKNTLEEFWDAKTSSHVMRIGGKEVARKTVKNPVLYKGPISLLVDQGCASACETFAYRAERAKRATIIGTRTYGIGNTDTTRYNLINGGVASISSRRAFWTDGTPAPSFVTPQFEVQTNLFELFNSGRDRGIEKAFDVLGLRATSLSRPPTF